MSLTASAADAVPQLGLAARFRRFRDKTLIAVGPNAMELSDSAAFILACVDGQRSVAGIGAMLAEEYGIDVDEAVADVADLIGQLVECRVLDLPNA
ncbi:MULTISPECIES: PqqD family protein [unclassified Streptomyces]|uniref:PqqD family protein n=1 Tax=unclassified Streptomyces TaxID=2593676 RepID=UPI000DB97B9D|nr:MULTISPECIES: PqqD family protein [unclassified Streptomyces]MYU03339.1 PqqD family peptide modification chaperone [Streptomyces sp. SID8366]MYU64886.1 PqqD family peptide modification chaperone [Streptomyces sp. SID69]RAJ57250.1 coenzyme PQQ synthesis protein D (PqqD) [Streptomyces sp. PsTaAH-130]